HFNPPEEMLMYAIFADATIRLAINTINRKAEAWGNADLLASCQKSARERKSAVFLSLANQTLTLLIWQPVHGLQGSTE
ncbi:MAG: hypothetical protein L3J61_02715, partial [Ghiorsea sp.]|nr:hypothetical protein [Ghiorsea sp.]